MDHHTLTVLEFHKVRELVAAMAMSEPGRQKCLALMPVSQRETALQLQQVAAEMKSLRSVDGNLPLEGLKDISSAIQLSRMQGSSLKAPDLLDILATLDSLDRTRRRLLECGDDCPQLNAIGKALIPLPELESAIRRSIGPGGEILDTASPRLARIRSNIARTKTQIKQHLESILYTDRYQSALQDRVITIRNDRFVIPIRADHRTALPCVVHDQSHSRATLFIEPLSIIDSNNELSLLCLAEREEEGRILTQLTALVGQSSDALEENFSVLCTVDLFHAIARWAESMHCSIPLLDAGDIVDIRGAHHPLLVHQFRREGREDALVPVDIQFGEAKRTLLISGANAGGKTVALKTLGLMALMAQSGIPIPAKEGSRLPVFRHIMADIGDEQNIEMNLSTFSAHVQRLVTICNVVDSSSLVLLDEIGVGTDPEEGAALACSILDYLRERKVFTAATTHMGAVKMYAFQHSDVVNASVAFDPEKLQPLYRLIYGAPGLSNAMAIMSNLGVPRQILTGVEAYRSEGQRMAARMMQNLHDIYQVMNIHYEEIRQIRAKATSLLSQMQQIQSTITNRKAELITNFEREVRDVIRRGRAEIRRIAKEVTGPLEGKIGHHWKELEDVRQQMHSVLKGVDAVKLLPLAHPPVKGQMVAIRSLRGMHGTVTQADTEDDTVEVLVGTMKVSTRIHDLAIPIPDDSPRPKKHAARGVSAAPQNIPFHPLKQVNIIGMRVEEAIPVVDKSIDEAILCGAHFIRIVHGHGTGRLRQAVHEHLRGHRGVSAINFAPPEEGGAGMTIVHLKE